MLLTDQSHIFILELNLPLDEVKFNKMKKLMVFIMALSILGGSIHADELCKLPMLLQHYKEHKKQHPSDSSIDFIYKHYIAFQKAESKKDQQSDSTLPFKSSQAFHSHLSPFVNELSNVELIIGSLPICHYSFYNSTVLSHCSDIWQPPQL